MNWGEIKLATLKKIDPSYTSLTSNRNTKDYLNSMVEVGNRGLQDLSTAGKYIIKSFEILQNPIENLLGDMSNIYQHLNDDIEYTATAYAYSFDVDNPCEVLIYVGDVLFDTITHETSVYTNYKGKITNDDDEDVTIIFSGDYPYQYTNLALYGVKFESDEKVWQYSKSRKYNFKTLVTDFYRLHHTDVVHENPYLKIDDYFWEGDSVLVLDGTQSGKWIVHYFAYPQTLVSSTPDNTDMALDPEVEALLPIYMASELYFEEAPSKATQFRNQYEAGKEQLRPSDVLGKPQFVDANGWV